MKVVGLRHAHVRGRQAIEGIDLGVLPRALLRLPPEARALGHGAGLARVLGLAVLGVVDRLAEAALVGFLVDLGAARVVAAAHHEDHRFLAAHELAHDGIDHAVFDQGKESLRGFQASE